jgi:hypothetical protein
MQHGMNTKKFQGHPKIEICVIWNRIFRVNPCVSYELAVLPIIRNNTPVLLTYLILLYEAAGRLDLIQISEQFEPRRRR